MFGFNKKGKKNRALKNNVVKLSPLELSALDLNKLDSKGLYSLSYVADNMKLSAEQKIIANTSTEVLPVEENKNSSPIGAPQTRYIIEEKIGEGGTAEVFRAIDKSLGRPVALKRFFPDKGPESDDGEYDAEIEVISRLHHPHIVITHDAGLDENGYFIVMNLLAGDDLQKTFDEEWLKFEDFKSISVQLLDGVIATHDSNILHLDLKPSNVMVSRRASGRIHATLVDYGSAKILLDTEKSKKINKVKGSIHFMSPEHINSAFVDIRSDVYSLGCIFYQCLTGNRPFEGKTSMQVMASHIMNDYIKIEDVVPSVYRPLAELIHQMLSLKMEDRPENCIVILDRIEKIFAECS